MLACAVLTPATPTSPTNMPLLVGLLSLGFGLGAWSRAGLYCNHQVGRVLGIRVGCLEYGDWGVCVCVGRWE